MTCLLLCFEFSLPLMSRLAHTHTTKSLKKKGHFCSHLCILGNTKKGTKILSDIQKKKEKLKEKESQHGNNDKK